SSASEPTVSSGISAAALGAGDEGGADRREGVRGSRHFVIAEDPNDDGGDVVEPTPSVRLRDERIHDSLRGGARSEELLQAPVVHHSREPVARDEKGVACLGLADVDVRLYLGGRAHTACDHVAVWVI